MGATFSSSKSPTYIYPATQSSNPPTRIYRIEVYKICRLVKQLNEDERKPTGVRVIIKINSMQIVGLQLLHAVVVLIHRLLSPITLLRSTYPTLRLYTKKSFRIETSSYAFEHQDVDYFSPKCHLQVRYHSPVYR